MVKALADHFEVDVLSEGDGGPGVAEAVDGESGEWRVGVGVVVLLLLAEEGSAESFRVVVPSVFAAEDEVVVLVCGAEQSFLFVLDVSPVAEEFDGVGVEVDEVAGSGLVAFFEDGAVVVVGGELVEHCGGAFGEVDVVPFESEDFAAA